MFTGLIIVFSFVSVTPAFASVTSTKNKANKPTVTQSRNGNLYYGQIKKMAQTISGTVSAINGNTITIYGKNGFGTSTPTTVFTVDATNAKVMKNNATSTVSNIAIRDIIVVQGTVSGTTITATLIRDDVIRGAGMMNGQKNGQENKNGINQIQGNGQPVVTGTISTISGSTITISNKGNVQYTVDATNAKVVKGNATSSISNVVVGDNVIVQGTVNGTSITASFVIIQNRPANQSTNYPVKQVQNKGLFGTIGNFFTHLFSF